MVRPAFRLGNATTTSFVFTTHSRFSPLPSGVRVRLFSAGEFSGRFRALHKHALSFPEAFGVAQERIRSVGNLSCYLAGLPLARDDMDRKDLMPLSAGCYGDVIRCFPKLQPH